MNSVDTESINAAFNLAGRTLLTGWYVREKITAKPSSTGGNFSICYLVEKDGIQGFMKVLNILSFFTTDQDMAKAISNMSNAYIFEKDVLFRCKHKNLTKVSKLLEADQETVPGFLLANILYMIFEKADDDVRNHLTFAVNIDVAWKLRSLHNIAVGIQQLHSIGISHQDIKPSNIFVYRDRMSKIGDLGRSQCLDIASPHSNTCFTGDKSYAPPEVWFNYNLPDWQIRAYSVDSYLLGSMIAFYLTGFTMNGLISQNMTNELYNHIFNGNSYENALPYLVEIYDSAFDMFQQLISDYNIANKEDLSYLLRILCNPHPGKRIHPNNLQKRGNKFDLQIFISVLNRIARKTEMSIYN
jgi:eukaryotic-like serine/threonine-protein kinase